MLPWLQLKIVYFLNFFDVWGYDSGSFSLSHYRKIIYFIYIFHISAFSLFTVFKLHLPRMLRSNHHLNMVEVVNVSMQFSAPLYTYWIIILDSLYHPIEMTILLNKIFGCSNVLAFYSVFTIF